MTNGKGGGPRRDENGKVTEVAYPGGNSMSVGVHQTGQFSPRPNVGIELRHVEAGFIKCFWYERWVIGESESHRCAEGSPSGSEGVHQTDSGSVGRRRGR